jgi:hypothetical protein
MSQRERPAAVLVIAILQFVGGGLGLLQDVSGAVMQATGAGQSMAKAFTPPAPPGGKPVEAFDADAFMKERIPHYSIYLWSHFTLDTLLCLLMILSGIGLLQMKQWGRRLAFGYAAYSILLRLWTVLYTVLFINAVTVEMVTAQQEHTLAQMGPQQAAAAAQVMQLTSKVMGVAVYFGVIFQLALLAYPMVVIFLLSRKSVSEAFADAEIERVNGALDAEAFRSPPSND